MPSYKFPILIWRDGDGLFTGSTADGPPCAAVDVSAPAVVNQLKQYLLWLYRRDPWWEPPDMREPRLAYTDVAIRPEYKVNERPYPCGHRLNIRVCYVTGLRRDGSRKCSLPMLQIGFVAHPNDSVDELVADYVRQRLQGLAPQELSRMLPPEETMLDQLVVKVTDRTSRQIADVSGLLESVADPLGSAAIRRRYHRALFRDREVTQLTQHLRSGNVNLLLVGESGVGKTSILIDAVRNAERSAAVDEEDNNDKTPRGNRFWQTSGARLIAGLPYLGQWEERCEEIIDALADLRGTLCIDDLVGLLQAGGGDPASSVAAFFAPYIERGELRIVAETTPQQLDACRRLLPGFTELFQVMNIESFDAAAARQLLGRLVTNQQRNHGIEIERGMVELIYRLFRRFLPYEVFPGSAVDFVADLFQRAAARSAAAIDKVEICDRFSDKTGLPASLVRDDLPLPPVEVAEAFRDRVIGQPQACDAAAGVVTTFKAGLNDPGRPLAVMLFCGPTGVGKTELAKTMADYLFGHGKAKDRLIRLDMSEYAGWDGAERILMRSNGEVSELIDKVRRHPFSVVLLDEIEKAALEVFDVLLGLFDEGRLTDQFGRTTNFTSAVIVMTSNLGGQRRTPIGFDEEARVAYEREVREFFRPELFNRIDQVISFNPLSTDHIIEITEKELRQIARRPGLVRRNIRLTWTPRLVEHLAHVGYDARYGARPLQRAIEQNVVAQLAHWLLRQRSKRDCTVQFDYDTAKNRCEIVS